MIEPTSMLGDNKPSAAGRLPIGFSHADSVGSIDRFEGAPLPVVRIFGWYAAAAMPSVRLVTHQGRTLAPLAVARYRRDDVCASGQSTLAYSGFRIDFLLQTGEQPRTLTLGNHVSFDFPAAGGFAEIMPHYESFYTRARVMGRNNIYGSGPPTEVAEEFKQFAALASGRILDFGCGNGDLIQFLRSRGHEAYGLELDEKRIRDALKPQSAPYVTLYRGKARLPFKRASFDWIVSTEVIEHVVGIAAYVPALAGLLRPGGRLLITTPDITSVPSSFPTNSVPWHLLEATHINFFTPQSVVALFESHFTVESTYSLAEGRVNGYFIPGSIGAVFVRKPDPPRRSLRQLASSVLRPLASRMRMLLARR